MFPYVNIHTHNTIDDKEIISIRNIDVDNIANVDVSRFYSVGIHPWNLKGQQSTDNGQQSPFLETENLKTSEFERSQGRMDVGSQSYKAHSSQPIAHSTNNSQVFRFSDSQIQNISQILRFSDSQILKAIGECGLDRACDSDFELQREVFIKQIELSEQYHKPLIIHAVRSYPDIISIRKETKSNQPWIIHGFNGNEHSAEQLLRHDGIYLSLGDVLFKNEKRAELLLDIIPSDRLFLETDVAERSIVEVYEKASLLSGVATDILRKDIFDNFVKIFGHI
ncbi:MAG: hypothetical protein E7065_06965 [Lentimicrobiaceae bacterium]|nr:hypothetical protein [Lentimicrobiaceae bacterium]